MNGVSVSEKLGLGPEVRELKFGSSFTGNKGQGGGAFHSIRYDFKPASVDTTKMSTLDVGSNSQVTISVPRSDGAGTNVFKGARKPYAKECVLIIDQETGEVILEKLTHNVQVKKTRQEGGSRGVSKNLPPAAAPMPEVKKPPPPSSLNLKPEPKSSKEDKKKSSNSSSSQQQLQQSNAMRSRRTHSPVPPRHSPLGPSPGHISPSLGSNSNPATAFDNLLSSHSGSGSNHGKPSQSSLPSLTSIEDLLLPPPAPVPAPTPVPPPPPAAAPAGRSVPTTLSNTPNIKSSSNAPPPSAPVAVGALSESSSGEDSSSSSSSDDDDDDSSDEEMEVVPDHVPIPGNSKPISPPIMTMPSLSASNMSKPISMPPPHMSMPSHLLTEDLQLSESGSDSD